MKYIYIYFMISSYHFGEIRLISLKNMKYKKINTGSQFIPESLFYEESFVSCAMLTLSDFIEVCLSLKVCFSPRNTDYGTLLYFLQ